MLINPMQALTPGVKGGVGENTTGQIVSQVIGHLVNYHADLLGAAQSGRETSRVMESIVREKICKDYSCVNIDLKSLLKKVRDRLFGYHILQKYIDDQSVSNIRAVAWDNIHIKRRGKWEHTDDCFLDQKDFLDFVRYCVLKNHGKITEEKPLVVVSDKKNNLRIEAGIPPVNVSSPNLVIRIHRPGHDTSLDDLFTGEAFMMNMEMYTFLIEAVTAGCSIIISGKGASGKTTLLRALVDKIPQNVAITSNEETAELFSTHGNIIQREILKNREPDKNISLEKLTSHSLIMTNDAIVVGELKGAEAMVFFDAVLTGHRGYATVHADAASLTIDRLVTLMKRDPQAHQYSDKYLKELLAQSVDLIIYMRNFRVSEIAEVIFNGKDGHVEYNVLFRFDVRGITDGEMRGIFLETGEPRQRVRKKLAISKNEMERLYEGVVP